MNTQLRQVKSRLLDSLIDIDDTQIADAAVLIAITNEPIPKIMLTRRAGHLKSHAGEVSLPGGKYEQGDHTNVKTALRETFEETGLLPDCVEIVGQLPPQRSKAGLSVRPIVGIIPPNQIYTAEISEIARIFWVDLAYLSASTLIDYRVEFNNEKGVFIFDTPSWLVEGERVWGLTGRIIASLLNIVFEQGIEWFYKPITK